MAEDTVRTVGRYGILREIGRGGMGVVYLARQLDLDRLVALKEMAAFHAADPALARRFVRESRLAGSVVHANVVTVFDYFEHAGTPYIAMELVERGSLRPYVGEMAPAQIGGVLEGLLAGLGAAEQRGIVHRDLKPENLMVTADGRVKIADFGIAKATQTTRTSAFVTATGTTIGTPQYMAPEQAMARDIGPWTDLYSVGCIAYELFGGAPPFHDADTPMAIMLRHINDPLPPVAEVAGVNRDISDWIERLTAKDRHDRPQTANDAWEALEEVLIAELGPRWRRESRLPEPPSRPGDRGAHVLRVPQLRLGAHALDRDRGDRRRRHRSRHGQHPADRADHRHPGRRDGAARPARADVPCPGRRDASAAPTRCPPRRQRVSRPRAPRPPRRRGMS